MTPFVHPKALVETEQIGEGTRVWAFAHVLEGAVIGGNCNIGDHCFIERGVEIGDEVVIKNGVSIWSGVKIEARAFIGPNVAFTNDMMPRARIYHSEYEHTLVREGASIGANATILCGLTLGRYSLVGAGSVVTRDVPDFALAYGNPARLAGWLCRCGQKLVFDAQDDARCGCGRSYHKRGHIVEEESLPG
jgi:acetyltransferase-like isoleucine patch superfamily enzyme